MTSADVTPRQAAILIHLLTPGTYQAAAHEDANHSELERLGLIQPDFYGDWGLTDAGRRTAKQILKEGRS